MKICAFDFEFLASYNVMFRISGLPWLSYPHRSRRQRRWRIAVGRQRHRPLRELQRSGLPNYFGQRFLETLHTARAANDARGWTDDPARLLATPVWGKLAVCQPIRLSTPRTEPSPVMAAEQFLPPGMLEAVSVTDATFGSLRLMQSRS